MVSRGGNMFSMNQFTIMEVDANGEMSVDLEYAYMGS